MNLSAMRVPAVRRALLVFGALALVIPVTKVLAGKEVRHRVSALFTEPPPPPAELVNVPVAVPRDHVIVLDDSLFGRSGRVRVKMLQSTDAEHVAGLKDVFGPKTIARPGVLEMATVDDPQAFAFITLLPWREKRGAYVGPYRMGWWPAERAVVAANYENPTGFIEVTPENQNVRMSEHFRLRDFVTHDQDKVWPKYVVLREALLDKLELVLQTMQAQGIATGNVRVLSGFRAPYYNAGLVAEGAARASRHQFGDASDIIIDSNHDGRMDDLNRDGRVDFQDTEVILRAVDEQRHCEASRYPALCVERWRSQQSRAREWVQRDGGVGRALRRSQIATGSSGTSSQPTRSVIGSASVARSAWARRGLDG